jgi:hypothetical protein
MTVEYFHFFHILNINEPSDDKDFTLISSSDSDIIKSFGFFNINKID